MVKESYNKHINSNIGITIVLYQLKIQNPAMSSHACGNFTDDENEHTTERSHSSDCVDNPNFNNQNGNRQRVSYSILYRPTQR